MTGNLHVGLAAFGAAIAVGLIGMKASDAVGRNPVASTKVLGPVNFGHRLRGSDRFLHPVPGQVEKKQMKLGAPSTYTAPPLR